MSDSETCDCIRELEFGSPEERARVLAAAASNDFGPLTKAMYAIDKTLLASTLAAHHACQEEAPPAAFADLAAASDERDASLQMSKAARQVAEEPLEPCTLSEEERSALLARLTSEVCCPAPPCPSLRPTHRSPTGSYSTAVSTGCLGEAGNGT